MPTYKHTPHNTTMIYCGDVCYRIDWEFGYSQVWLAGEHSRMGALVRDDRHVF
jgi:hypothetical protein